MRSIYNDVNTVTSRYTRAKCCHYYSNSFQVLAPQYWSVIKKWGFIFFVFGSKVVSITYSLEVLYIAANIVCVCIYSSRYMIRQYPISLRYSAGAFFSSIFTCIIRIARVQIYGVWRENVERNMVESRGGCEKDHKMRTVSLQVPTGLNKKFVCMWVTRWR